MKKIMVCCGSSMITSTIAINKLKTAMANAGIDVKFIQCKFAEVQGKVKVERPGIGQAVLQCAPTLSCPPAH